MSSQEKKKKAGNRWLKEHESVLNKVIAILGKIKSGWKIKNSIKNIK